MASILVMRPWCSPPIKSSHIIINYFSAPQQLRMESSSSTAVNATSDIPAKETVVQYVVLRRDLIDTWPLGSVVTQGCHASVAAIWAHKDDPHTLLYCDPPNLDSMHKVTLEVKGETQMLNLSEKLKVGGIAHKLWIEQPENIPTCLATKPYPKSHVSSFFKKLKLSEADGTVDSAFGLEIQQQRHKAKPWLTLHVHCLHHSTSSSPAAA